MWSLYSWFSKYLCVIMLSCYQICQWKLWKAKIPKTLVNFHANRVECDSLNYSLGSAWNFAELCLHLWNVLDENWFRHAWLTVYGSVEWYSVSSIGRHFNKFVRTFQILFDIFSIKFESEYWLSMVQLNDIQ
jgi:hypothetical protein